jgi:hypothetical protein
MDETKPQLTRCAGMNRRALWPDDMRRAITRRGFTPGVAFVFGGQAWHNFNAMQRQQKITFGDHRCSHSTTALAMAGLACGRRGADVRSGANGDGPRLNAQDREFG